MKLKNSDGKHNGSRLYNVLFPLWMLMLFPQMWAIVLPGNFIIDSLVLVAAMFALKIADKRSFYKRHILKIFAFGLISDLVGAAYILLLWIWAPQIITWGDELYLTLPALVISAVCIFIFGYFATFKKSVRAEKLRLSLIFAIVTAPYTFLVPSSWLY